jgi:hypothetical protein
MIQNFRVSSMAVLSLSIASCGWNTSEFSEGKAKGMLEAKPVTLESEQVSLSLQQVDCGVGADLWDSRNQVSRDRAVARLKSDAQPLGFTDDVSVAEAGYHQPYVQVRGSFMLQVDDVSSIRDAKEQGVKIVDVKAGIRINHPCFSAPLPLMGVRHGSFNQDTPASFEFSLQNDGWHLDGMVH